jgi:hypothetical protein
MREFSRAKLTYGGDSVEGRTFFKNDNKIDAF